MGDFPRGAQASIDFAVINALGAGHQALTANGSGTTAATAYSERKAVFEDTAARCLENNTVLKPVVFTAQGGLDPNGAKTLEVIHRAVAAETGKPVAKVRAAFKERVSVLLVRANARAARRRDPDGPHAAQRSADPIALRAQAAMRQSAQITAPEENVADMPFDIENVMPDFVQLAV